MSTHLCVHTFTSRLLGFKFWGRHWVVGFRVGGLGTRRLLRAKTSACVEYVHTQGSRVLGCIFGVRHWGVGFRLLGLGWGLDY